MRHRVWVGIVAMAALPFSASHATAGAALDSLVASERAFAAMSAARGMKEAFLTYLAEDAIVFEPTATSGRQVWESRPASTATLLWEPSFAEVSSAGDLGYTMGPWEYRPPADSAGTPAPPERYAYGHFHTVWRKPHGGPWRVVVDIGCSHARPEGGGVGSGEFVPGPMLPIRTMKAGRVNLAGQDQKLSKAMRTRGTSEALAAYAAADLRLSIEGRVPSLGLEASQARLESLGGFLEYRTEDSEVSSSGDLGYTYGLAERFTSANAAPSDSSAFLHVWRQEGGHVWRLALEVLNPLSRR